jgi:hypothetical protein
MSEFSMLSFQFKNFNANKFYYIIDTLHDMCRKKILKSCLQTNLYFAEY